MPTLSELLISNPHGLGIAPPAIQYDGDITNSLDPRADYIGQKFGPEAGALAQKLLNAGVNVRDTAKGVAKGLSGIGMAEDAGTNLANAVDRGDPISAAGSVAQAGLAAIPVGGPRLAELLYKSTPRALGLAATLGASDLAAKGLLSPAEAGDVNPLDALYKRQADALQKVQDLTAARDAEGRTGKGPKYQDLDRQLKGAVGEQSAIDNMIHDENEKNSPKAIAAQKQADYEQQKANERAELDKPFSERHPYINEAMTVGAPMMSAGLSFAGMRGIANKGNKLLSDLLQARKDGDVVGMQEAASRLAGWENPMTRYSKQAAAFALPATLPVDMRLMGDTIDKYTLPTDSKAQKAANDRLADIPKYLRDSEQALMSGLVLSATGGKAGAMTAGGAPGSDARAMLGLYGKKDSATLSKLLQEGAAATEGVQAPIGRAQSAMRDREAASSLTDRKGQLLEEAAGVSPAIASSSEPAHHSVLQPRNNKGRFSGPPQKPKNDN